MTNRLLATFAFVILWAMPCMASQPIQVREVHVCDFEVGSIYRQANLSGPLKYEVTLDSKGIPTSYKSITSEQYSDMGISRELVINCLRRWKFAGDTEGASVTISFYWDHYVGWKEITIESDTLYQKILLKDRQ